VHDPAAAISAVELEDLFREINAENVDLHDEPPHVWLSGSVSPEGRHRVHLSEISRLSLQSHKGGSLTSIGKPLNTSAWVFRISQLLDLGYIYPIHPDDLGSLAQAWTHSIETGEPYSQLPGFAEKTAFTGGTSTPLKQ
jgi:hypothetical protein